MRFTTALVLARIWPSALLASAKNNGDLQRRKRHAIQFLVSGPGSPPKERRFRVNGWVVVTLIALSATVGHAFGRFSFGVLLPAVRDDLGISNTLAGFIGGTNVGFYLIGTLLVSWMAGRYRLLGIMRLGLLLA
ncbi:MAG: YbfB/YjiJ family MFS transporter, partial [Pseudomonadales bacterium]|nr:YbfB/YjiJ family MFS transporter [Pseudomonadales bacterium]